MGRLGQPKKKAERERKKRNQAAYRERQQAKGLKLWRTWATADEIEIFQKVKKDMPKLIEMMRKKSVTRSQQINESNASAVGDA